MANPTFHNYASAEAQSIAMHYSQAVILPGGTIKTSGQGGWDSNGSVAASASEQVDLAFKNIDKALQAVDSRLSWKNVYTATMQSFASIHQDVVCGWSLEAWVRSVDHLQPWYCVKTYGLSQRWHTTLHSGQKVPRRPPGRSWPRLPLLGVQ
jgi:enamine deaminase RidA (YjgF/YER057c/UK114 family)